VTVHNFSNGLLNPALAYAMSCLGAFLGLRCVTLARAYESRAKVRWLGLAAVSIGAIGIWAMHFIAMLGFTVPGEPIRYNVPVTVGSMLLSVAVVGMGLFVVGYARPNSTLGGWPRLLVGGAIVGAGVAAMHYMGMAAVSMPGSMSYNGFLVLLSVVIAVVAGTVALWIGTWIRGVAATVGASLVMGAAVTGMHYTAMAALHVTGAVPPTAVTAVSGLTAVSGATAAAFVIPSLLVIGLATFLLTLAVSMSPSEAEIRADAEFQRRLERLERLERRRVTARRSGGRRGTGAWPSRS
jgi:NO-binding membrane sensor protein with MHYT domain